MLRGISLRRVQSCKFTLHGMVILMEISQILEAVRIPLACWFGIVSLIAVILTAYDKSASWKRGRRIPERTLLLCAFFGGALAMYVTMQLIRHKTNHSNFMIPLPLFILMHMLLAWAVYLM